MKRVFIQILLVILALLPSIQSNTTAQLMNDDINFELNFTTNFGNFKREQMSRFIQAAIEPLNIGVNLNFKTFSTFVNDLLHGGDYEKEIIPTVRDYEDWDLAIISWAGESFPSFIHASFNSKNVYGCLIYQLCNKKWQEWQIKDTGVNQLSLDSEIEQIIQTVDPIVIKQELLNFSEFYMGRLLYGYPLLLTLGNIATPSNLKNYDPYLGARLSVFRGLAWDQSSERNDFLSRSELCNDLAISCNFDPLQSRDTMTDQAIHPLTMQLLTPEPNRIGRTVFHPGFAQSYEISDWIKNGTSVKNGKTKFWLYHNIPYHQNIVNSTKLSIVGPHYVQPQDFLFSIQLWQQLVPNFLFLEKVEINSTENSLTLYTPTPTINSIQNYAQLTPTPTFLLNQTLTYNKTLSADPFELFEIGLSPFDTFEWDDYEHNPVAAGPFKITEYDYNETLLYQPRDDFWFPNEWDTSDFARHIEGEEPAFYFTYNKTESRPQQKPTNFLLDIYGYKIHDTRKLTPLDVQQEILRWYIEGKIDVLGNIESLYGKELLIDLQNNPDHIVYTYTPNSSGEILVFNLLNPHLKKYNIRRAIASSIDKAAMNQLFDGSLVPVNSPIWRYQGDWYTDDYAIPYDCNAARDLMRLEGYIAQDSCEFNLPGEVPQQVLSENSSTPLLNSPLFILPLIVLYRRRVSRQYR